jgi:hypothetical protein
MIWIFWSLAVAVVELEVAVVTPGVQVVVAVV